MDYNVLIAGAIGDGIADDTAALQHALDVCQGNGGGRVILPGGHTFLSRSLFLRPSVDLHLQRDL